MSRARALPIRRPAAAGTRPLRGPPAAKALPFGCPCAAIALPEAAIGAPRRRPGVGGKPLKSVGNEGRRRGAAEKHDGFAGFGAGRGVGSGVDSGVPGGSGRRMGLTNRRGRTITTADIVR